MTPNNNKNKETQPQHPPLFSPNIDVKKAEGTITTIYIAPSGGVTTPMRSVQKVKLIAHVGIEGDRYATYINKGTYSGKFLMEPGRNLTLVSEDAIKARIKELPQNQQAFTMDKLRRNIVVKGLSAQDINDMVGYEISLGYDCKLFVHRRNVPCKYRQADTKCPTFRNTFWEDCGICCEIIKGGTVHVGDKIRFSPDSDDNPYQPNRINVGLKPKHFFKKPSSLTLKEVKEQIIPVYIAVALCLWDPIGFEQVERGYNSVGQCFWSPRAYKVGTFVRTYIRLPLLATFGVGITSIVIHQTIQYVQK